MFTYIKKKIIEITDKVIAFFKDNLSQIIFLVFFIQILLGAESLPYINLIKNYEFYVTGLFIFLAMLIFRVIIPYERVLQIVLGFFIVASIVTIFDQTIISDLLGFIIFVLLLLIVGRQILREKEDLKKIYD